VDAVVAYEEEYDSEQDSVTEVEQESVVGVEQEVHAVHADVEVTDVVS
jgi:hypothetical protein